jgi:transglutaminase-like putative cysteine protease
MRAAYHVRHLTVYDSLSPVTLCHNQIRLTPRTLPAQRCLDWRVQIDPEPTRQSRWVDAFGNEVLYASIEQPHRQLRIEASSRVERLVEEIPHPADSLPWEQVVERLSGGGDPVDRRAELFRGASPFIPLLVEAREYAWPSFTPGRSLLDAVFELTDRIHRDFRYTPASTGLTTTTREVLERRCGVCQDFAHLQINCLRSLGLAARYVSGYLRTDPPPGQPRLVGADASHAWISVFSPGQGWIDFDPTNNCIPAERHLTIGWGRDYSDIAPVKGVYIGGFGQSIQVAVDVELLADGVAS